MKTIFLSNKPLVECESTHGKSTHWLRSLPLRLGSLVTLWLQQLRQYVTLGKVVGSNNIKVAYNETLSNNRVFVGVVLVMVSPIFWWAHLFFDYDVVIKGWYYKNWFFWFFTNREELMFAIGLTGFFLICPQKWGFRYLLTPIVTLCVTEVIYQSLQISHWTHFYNPMWSTERGWELGLIVLVSVFAAYKIINYMVYRKYHLKDGNMARITGIIKAPGITWEQKGSYLEKLVNETEQFNSRI